MLSKTKTSVFKPRQIVKFIGDIDLSALERKGIKVLLIDIDNTVVPRNRFTVAFEFINWFNEARERGFKVFLVSNFIGKREREIARQLNVNVLGVGFKPVLFFMEDFLTRKIGNYSSDNIALIGDNFTLDVITGNVLKYFTILVEDSYSQSGKGKISVLKDAYLKIINEKVSDT
jgi:HAD superfamily phosphatase (TIGR01668 family)